MKQILILFSFLLLMMAITNKSEATTIPNQLIGRDLKMTSVEWSKGKASVVVFLSSVCPCSNSYNPTLTDLYKEFSPKGIQFVAINSNVSETVPEVEKYFTESHLPFPVLRDNNNQWADQFGALNTPHAFVVNAKGSIIYSGGIGSNRKLNEENQKETTFYLKEVLTDIVQDKTPRYSQTKSFGCAIRK